MAKSLGAVPVWSAAAAIALTAFGAGCSSDDGEGGASGGGADAKKVAFLLPESKTARYETKDRPYFTEALEQACSNCELLYYNANGDATRQQQQVETALTDGADVIVINPVDSEAAKALVTRAKQQDVPVVDYGRVIPDAEVDAVVNNAEEQVGELQGEALRGKLEAEGDGSATIVMINGAPSDYFAGVYKRGAHSALDPSDLTIGAEYDTADWSPDKAQQEMEQAITRLGKESFAGVLAANDGMAGGAIAAMKAAGIDPLPPVTGQDAELAAIQRIVAGEQYMTVYKQIRPMAERAAELAASLANGRELPERLINDTFDNGSHDVPRSFAPVVAITRDNVQKDIIDDGFWTYEDICTSNYRAACDELGLEAG